LGLLFDTRRLTHLPAATRRSALLLSFATFGSMAVQRICDAMLPELSLVFNVSLTEAARVIWMLAVVYGAAQLVYGPMGDRLGKFRIVTYATIGCSVASLLAVFVGSLDALVLARVAMGLCAAAIIPLSMAWIGDAVPFEQRQEVLAKVGLGTTLGLVGGQLMGGLLTDTLGWRWAFGVLALLFAVVGGLMYSDHRRQPAPAAPSQEAPRRPSFVGQAWRIVTEPWARYILLIAMVEGACGFGVLAIIASHLHRELALSLTASGAIVAMFGIGGVLYMALARHLIRRLGETGLAQWGGSLMGVSFLLLGFATWWPLTPLVCLIAGFGFFMFHNTMQLHATQMAPTARGTAVSLFASCLFIGQAVGVLLAANLIALLGSGVVIALGGGGIMALGFMLARGLRRRALQTDTAL
jgi:YNFM family putative membrane transporter